MPSTKWGWKDIPEWIQSQDAVDIYWCGWSPEWVEATPDMPNLDTLGSYRQFCLFEATRMRG